MANDTIFLKASTQADLEAGIETFLATPAAQRWLDITLLGAIDLDCAFYDLLCKGCGTWMRRKGEVHERFIGPEPEFCGIAELARKRDYIHGVRVGCESGPKRRLWPYMQGESESSVEIWMSWLHSIIDQCAAAGVKVRVESIPLADNSEIGWRVSTDMSEWPEWAQRQEAASE